MKLPIDIFDVRKGLISGKLTINEILKERDTFRALYHDIIKSLNQNEKLFTADIILYFIMICLDCYAYSETGDTLISDHEYDTLVNAYRAYTHNEAPIYPDTIGNYTTWPFIKHEAPGMVGSVNKIYDEYELKRYMAQYIPMYGKLRSYIIAPKFDGVSASIKVNENGRILLGVTRADGVEGQDITRVVQNAHNSNIFQSLKPGYYKCELCVGKSDFMALIEEKKYANRRSATTGIINTPKNLHLARYITIIPLAYFDGKSKVNYIPPDTKIIKTNNSNEMRDEIYKMLDVIRNASYEFRTDGVVIYPLGDDVNINYSDIMDNAIAYKVNTEEALTNIKYGYVSIGRLGYAVPMLKVEPVEVNETIVEDVSLGSFDKYASMDMHEGETVVIYSAGNVIPQARIPENRHYKAGSDYLKIKKRCPYCNEKLERIGNEYKCTNDDCSHVKAGMIVNFLTKLGAENLSDATIQDLYDNRLITDIPSIFELKAYDIVHLDGYADISAENIVNEIKRIQEKEIHVSTFMGALGIQDISEKKCRNIFKHVTIDQVLEKSEEKLKYMLLNADKTGDKTADVFVKFVSDNKRLIKKLLSIMNIVSDTHWKGNVVFTGFRNSELSERFAKIGYEVSDNVNSDTVAVINASFDDTSTKCKVAKKKGISIVHVSDADDVIKSLRLNKY
jgi:DNA ligase (NAD+)